MGEKIGNLEPQKVFGFFEKITKIARGSGNEKAISDYLVKFADIRGLIAYQDEYFNVTILKPATADMEDRETVILQAHMDMVCVADEGAATDPAKEGVSAYVEGDYIYANGTSLGADDGIGMAFILAVLDSDDISHPMIEAVFTACEEDGLIGAEGYDASRLKGKRFINIDTEEENNIVIGCAGGCRIDIPGKCKNSKEEGNIYEIGISGLAGGHSGMMIDRYGANANVLMARLFDQLLASKIEFRLGSFDGGTRDNAICASAVATVVVKKKQGKAFEKIVKSFADAVSSEYLTTDPEMKIKCKDKGKGKLEVMSTKDLIKFTSVIKLLPNGVHHYDRSQEMVICSTNIGVVSARPKGFQIQIGLRGNKDSMLEWIISSVTTVASLHGLTGDIRGRYPAWECDRPSDFAVKAQELYKSMFDKDIDVIRIHAGLECAIFTKKIKNIDAISVGPDMEGVHTTSERLSVSSTKREWEYLKALLKL
ncbi:MAG: beta-Ala-His dipeptidase [Lachnospiraceae bacterium]|nr:beta-Ala-His dipeptidase [Lachnospiraceae bacterium]